MWQVVKLSKGDYIEQKWLAIIWRQDRFHSELDKSFQDCDDKNVVVFSSGMY